MSRGVWIAPDWETRLSAAGLRTPLELLERSPAELGLAGCCTPLTKPGLGGRQRWRWEWEEGPGRPVVLYIKRYESASPWAEVGRVVRQTLWHSRAWWEYQVSRRLSEAYIAAPRAVAAAEAMRGPHERRSVVLFEAAPGDALDRVWRAACRDGAPVTRGLARHDLIVRLARFVAAFHQTGCCHRDLYLCHVFVDLDPHARRPPRFTLIDLARVFPPRVRRMRWIIKDLAQLDSAARQVGASRADRLRFLHAYLGLQPGAPRGRWFARRIVRKSDAILRRLARQSAAR